MPKTIPKPTSAPFASKAVYSHIYPLDEFYAQRDLALPIIGRTRSEDVPEPYHSLLVHRRDMTSTLENFHRAKIHIRVLERHVHENEYFRLVVLQLDGSDKPVEFGAIKIVLDLFPSEAQQEILREQRPLGYILNEFKIAHRSLPQFYLTVKSDDLINSALGLKESQTLYGRRNTLADPWDRPLAEIVEILPP